MKTIVACLALVLSSLAVAACAVGTAEDSAAPEEEAVGEAAEALKCKAILNDSCTYIYNLPYDSLCPANSTGKCPNPSDPDCAGKRCYCECDGL